MTVDPQLDLVHRAIRSGIFGNIEWKDTAEKRIRADPEMNGLTRDIIRDYLRRFVLDGGSLAVRQETRAEWLDADDPYWYRALIPIPDYPRPLFLEVKVLDDDSDEPFVSIVSAHF